MPLDKLARDPFIYSTQERGITSPFVGNSHILTHYIIRTYNKLMNYSKKVIDKSLVFVDNKQASNCLDYKEMV